MCLFGSSNLSFLDFSLTCLLLGYTTSFLLGCLAFSFGLFFSESLLLLTELLELGLVLSETLSHAVSEALVTQLTFCLLRTNQLLDEVVRTLW